MGPLVPAHRPPVGSLRRDVAAGEAAQDLLIRRLGILLALLAGKRTGPSEQQPGGELGRRPVPLPGVVLEPIRAQDAQVRSPNLPEPLDQRGVGLIGGVDLNRDKVLGDGGGDRRLAVADTGQGRAAASSGGEEVHQDQRAGCPGLLAGGVQVSGPPPDRFHVYRLPARGRLRALIAPFSLSRRPDGEPLRLIGAVRGPHCSRPCLGLQGWRVWTRHSWRRSARVGGSSRRSTRAAAARRRRWPSTASTRAGTPPRRRCSIWCTRCGPG